MISFIQKFFHTDKWWGKTIFFISIYILYWCVFYGSWFLIPYDYFYNRNIEINQLVFLFFFCAFSPLISFFIPFLIKKLFSINKFLLYFLHIILILISLALFLHIGLIIAFSHFQIG